LIFESGVATPDSLRYAKFWRSYAATLRQKIKFYRIGSWIR